VRVNDKVTDGVKDTKRVDANGAVCGVVYGEDEGVETVVLKRDHGIFGVVLFAIFVEPVFHGEPGWVPNAAHMNVSVVASEREGCLCYLPHPLANELGVWNRREYWFGEAGTRG